ALIGYRQHKRPDQECHRPPYRAMGHAGDGGGDQGYRSAREHAAGDGERSGGRTRAPRQDRGGGRRISGRREAWRGGRYHNPASGGASASHAADHGGNFGGKE